MLTSAYDEALVLAAALHRTQRRKGSEVPYLSHLLSVSALVLENGGTQVEAIAALLHDAVEDAGDGPAAERIRREIRGRFGPEVLGIVEACTDADPVERARERAQPVQERRASWRARKERYIEHLERAPGPVLLVAAADKLHNARAIARDLELEGRTVFDRFFGAEEGTLWYYRTLTRVLAARVRDEPRIAWLAVELERVVDLLTR